MWQICLLRCKEFGWCYGIVILRIKGSGGS